MKLPNGYGSVFKLSGNRRNPWIARVTKGFKVIEGKARPQPIYQVVGYYHSKSAALQALAEYNNAPYDLNAGKITFEQVYEKWSEKKFKEISDSGVRTYKASYSYCTPIKKMKMTDVRPINLQECIDNADVGVRTKKNMKSLFNQLYEYCLFNEMCKTNYAESVKVSEVITEKEKIPFTSEEVGLLWDNRHISVYVDYILILLYSGWRAGELADMKCADVYDGCMHGGKKTKAGKNRVVPIHSAILPIIEKIVNSGNEYIVSSKSGEYAGYNVFYKNFKKIMRKLAINHSPHDTRHTFITKLDDAGANKVAIQKLVGHSGSDVTEKVYTHKDIEQLKKAIELLNF